MNLLSCLFLSTLTLLVACSQPQESTQSQVDRPFTTMVIVRHAEKADDGSENPPLTEFGQARAQLLQALLRANEIAAIYSTSHLRNQQTVQPLADSLNLEIREYDAGRDATGFMVELVDRHAGEKILICGHSNTVPTLLNALTGTAKYQQFADDAYDDCFVAVAQEPGKAVINHLKYRPR